VKREKRGVATGHTSPPFRGAAGSKISNIAKEDEKRTNDELERRTTAGDNNEGASHG